MLSAGTTAANFTLPGTVNQHNEADDRERGVSHSVVDKIDSRAEQVAVADRP